MSTSKRRDSIWSELFASPTIRSTSIVFSIFVVGEDMLSDYILKNTITLMRITKSNEGRQILQIDSNFMLNKEKKY